jgi:hypothetical protein
MLTQYALHYSVSFSRHFFIVHLQQVKFSFLPELEFASKIFQSVRMRQEIMAMPDFFNSIQTY